MPTLFIPSYDTERQGQCVVACEGITSLHQEMDIPATFFLVSSLLRGEERGPYQRLLGHPLFEVSSHTVTHRLLRDHAALGLKASPWEEVVLEVTKSKSMIEDAFGKPCPGICAPCSFERGFGDDQRLVKLVADTGYRYSCATGWGPKWSLPVPLDQAWNYGELGYPDLWEFPKHGWHENVLKGHNATPGRFLLWPPVYPEHVVTRLVETPEEEFEVHKFFIDKAVEEELEYVALIWHPWSLHRFDPECRMLRMIFEYARAKGCEFGTFEQLRERKDREVADAASVDSVDRRVVEGAVSSL